jgi:outer membrane receptor for ferrienterochelin and colicins
MKYKLSNILKSSAVFMLLFSVGLYAQDLQVEYGEDTAEEKEEVIKQDKKEDVKKAQIVVTGTRSKKLYRKAPVKTEVVSRDHIEAKSANNLFEALSGESGIVADNQCQNCGLNTVRLNGLEGNYTQILVNSVPGVSSLASTYFFQQVPTEMIERVEIVRGGGSALYGSGAIGGVVNIITRKPNKNAASVSYEHEFIDSDTMTYNISGYASSVADSGKMGIAVYGARQNAEGYDVNGDGITDLAGLENTLFGGNAFYTIMPGMDLSVQFFNIHEYRRGGVEGDTPEVQTFVTEMIDSDISLGMLKFEHTVSDMVDYELNYNFSYMERKTYYGNREDLTDNNELYASLSDYGVSRNPYHLANGIVNVYPLKQLTLTGGVEFMYDDLYDGSALEGTASIDEKYYNIGTFLQANWEQKLFDVVAGLRMDKHNALDDLMFSPRVSGIVNFTDNLRFRASYSSGFKAPQVFDEDFHIEQSTIAGETKNRRIRNASDLKAETSHSFSSDFTGDFKLPAKFDLDFGTGIFYTMIYDKMEIDYENPSAEDASTKYYDRVNVDGRSQLLGYNAELGLSWSEYLRLSSGFTVMQFSELEDGSEMQEVPSVSGFTMLEGFYKGLTVTLSNVIMGKQWIFKESVNGLVETPMFAVFNARVAYRFSLPGSSYLEVYGGVDNITNQYQDDLDRLDISGSTVSGERDAGYVYGPGKPRTYYLGAKAGF